MDRGGSRTIRIAAALIDDDAGRLLLVRKSGTRWFMQAGGKIEPGEDALSALRRELTEEIGLAIHDDDARYLGRFSASAANEPATVVDAELFHVRVYHTPRMLAEIEEALWVSASDAAALSLAPLTRDVVLPLSQKLQSSSRAAL